MADLVADPLEIDDEGVHSDADGDNEPGHARQGEPVAHGPGQQGDDEVGRHGGHDQGGHGDHGQAPVLPQEVGDDEQEADESGDEAVAQLLDAQESSSAASAPGDSLRAQSS